jgi:hypothetical protein
MQEDSVVVAISRDTYDRVDAFRPVVEAVLGEPVVVAWVQSADGKRRVFLLDFPRRTAREL